MSDAIAMPPIGEAGGNTRHGLLHDEAQHARSDQDRLPPRKHSRDYVRDAAWRWRNSGAPPDVVSHGRAHVRIRWVLVCSQIKQNRSMGRPPVILMSGVVNKSVADRA